MESSRTRLELSQVKQLLPVALNDKITKSYSPWKAFTRLRCHQERPQNVRYSSKIWISLRQGSDHSWDHSLKIKDRSESTVKLARRLTLEWPKRQIFLDLTEELRKADLRRKSLKTLSLRCQWKGKYHNKRNKRSSLMCQPSQKANNQGYLKTRIAFKPRISKV